jgi:predicted Zn finger-like uncharacterized protein
MHIVCPHCTTSYAINPATLGAAGRTVRCSRCKEVWLARPEDAVEPAAAMAEAGGSNGDADLAAQWGAGQDEAGDRAPHVDSPSIAGDWRDEEAGTSDDDWASAVQNEDDDARPRAGWLGKLTRRSGPARLRGKPLIHLPTVCAAMGALTIALVVWRADVVRHLPQTASFYRMVGLDVNLRGLLFKDVKVTTETVEGKPVLVIEGAIVGETRKTVDLPRLRFAVRDAQGTEIYAWNSVLEQTVLKPGDRALFKSRLASPPVEGRSIDIRFFNKRDIAGGSV